jgi:hypothetical protein
MKKKLQAEQKPQYKVKEKGENVLDTIITKSNFDLDFTLREVQENIDRIKKMKVELSSKARLDDAVCKNIEGTNPEIKDIDPRILKVYHIYAKAKFFVEEAQEQIKRFDEVLDEEQKALEEIKVQTGVEI